MTLFYSKKSQRPERKTFQVKLETRQVTWSRGSEKIEGAGECRGGGGGGGYGDGRETRAGRGGKGLRIPRGDGCGAAPAAAVPGSRRSPARKAA